PRRPGPSRCRRVPSSGRRRRRGADLGAIGETAMPDRRSFLKIAAFAAAGSSLAACEGVSRVAWLFGRATPPSSGPGEGAFTSAERDARRLLGRLAYGPRPGDVARVAALGPDAYLEEQLAWERIDDSQARLLVRHVEIARLGAPDVFLFSASEAVQA